MKINDTVKTKHNTIGVIIAIYDGNFPYVVRIIKEGISYVSDYNKNELTLITLP